MTSSSPMNHHFRRWTLAALMAIRRPLWILFAAAGAWLGPWRSVAGPGAEVVLYCAQDQVFAEPMLAEFTRETGVRVRPVFDSEAVKTVGIANRLLSERDHPVCDVYWGNEEFRARQLAAAGVFRLTNGWAAFGQRSRRLVFNTRLLATNAAPTTLAALTNSAWKGRVSMAFPLFGTTSTHLAALRQKWGVEIWRTWCRALVANKPWIEEGNSQVAQRVGRGQAWIGLTDSDDAAAAAADGLPVAALPVTAELLILPNTVGVVRNGPHPEDADRLFRFLQTAPVIDRLRAAGGLETLDAQAPTLRPDWDSLLRDLPATTRDLEAIFRP